jgi:hypothetical protein
MRALRVPDLIGYTEIAAALAKSGIKVRQIRHVSPPAALRAPFKE